MQNARLTTCLNNKKFKDLQNIIASPFLMVESEAVNMKKYTTYEQTADKEIAGKDIRKESDWFLYYLQYVDNSEYPDFVTWLVDMIKSGNLIEEKED